VKEDVHPRGQSEQLGELRRGASELDKLDSLRDWLAWYPSQLRPWRRATPRGVSGPGGGHDNLAQETDLRLEFYRSQLQGMFKLETLEPGTFFRF
jgi:hypothetical protein